MPEPDTGTVTAWRLTELEKSFKELRGEVKEAVGTLGGGLTALQTQLSTYQTAISDKYVHRRDFEALVRRMEDQESKRSQMGWQWVNLVVAILAGLVAFAAWLRPFPV